MNKNTCTTFTGISSKHCFIENFEGELKFETYIEIIDSLVKLGKKKVSLSGGEIFLRNDIQKILYYAKEKNIEVSCVSNGSMITKDIAKCIKETDTKIGISLDGPANIHNSIRNNNSAFKYLTNTINLFKKYDIEFAVITSVMKENISSLDWVIEFCINNDVNEFRVQPIEADGNAKRLMKENKILNENERTDLYKKVIDMSGEYISQIRIRTLGNFRSEIIEHGCKFGLKSGSSCHSNSTPWPSTIGINTNGYIIPLNSYLENSSFFIGNINEGLPVVINNYYNSEKHKMFLDLLQVTFKEEILARNEEYLDFQVILGNRMNNFKRKL